MKELDLLKKDWQKNGNSFEQVSEVEIYKMLHKKSSSVVKWILIVSILEFVVLNGIGYLLPEGHKHHYYSQKLEHYMDLFQIISYGVTFFFMYLFYKNYHLISATSTTKKLMETILKTRKTVQYYIFYNLSYIVIMVSSVFFYLVLYDPIIIKKSANHNIAYVIFITISLTFVMVGIVWLFYRLIYGFLLKKLKRNYEELKKIDLQKEG